MHGKTTIKKNFSKHSFSVHSLPLSQEHLFQTQNQAQFFLINPKTWPTTLSLQAKQPTPTYLHISNKTSSLMCKMYALHYAQLFSDSRNEHSENEAHYWLLHYTHTKLPPPLKSLWKASYSKIYKIMVF